MKVVDEHESIKEIEKIINAGIIEELIIQAHSELKLLRIMRAWEPWNHFLNHETTENFQKKLAALRHNRIFIVEDEPVIDTKETEKLAEEYMEELKKRK